MPRKYCSYSFNYFLYRIACLSPVTTRKIPPTKFNTVPSIQTNTAAKIVPRIAIEPSPSFQLFGMKPCYLLQFGALQSEEALY